MAITIDLAQPPSNKVFKGVKISSEIGGSAAKVQWPSSIYISRDIGAINGFLDALDGTALDGRVEYRLHEGAVEVTVELTVYSKEAQAVYLSVVSEIKRLLVGIAEESPQSDFRTRRVYKMIWQQDPSVN